MRWFALKTALVLMFVTGTAAAAGPSDDEIRQTLIEESIAAYPGNCPCPYSTDSAGRRCGKRSAYLKSGGGRRPLCYAGDVTDEMVKKHKR